MQTRSIALSYLKDFDIGTNERSVKRKMKLSMEEFLK